MSRKFYSVVDSLIRGPWCVSAMVATVVYVTLKFIVPHFAASASNPIHKAIGAALPGVAALAAVVFGGLAAGSVIFAKRQRKILDSQPEQAGPDS